MYVQLVDTDYKSKCPLHGILKCSENYKCLFSRMNCISSMQSVEMTLEIMSH
jgi:hypothetical protein